MFGDEEYDIIVKYNRRLIRNGENECWDWKGCKNQGYGNFRHRNRMLRIHRVSYQLRYGIIPKNKMILHKCDNRSCSNPNHLFLGNAKSNYEDARQKGRLNYQKNLLTENKKLQIINLYKLGNVSQFELSRMFQVGELQIQRTLKESSDFQIKVIAAFNRKAKLNWKQVNDMRQLNQEKGFGAKKLGKMFQVSATSARRIIRNQNWKILSLLMFLILFFPDVGLAQQTVSAIPAAPVNATNSDKINTSQTEDLIERSRMLAEIEKLRIESAAKPEIIKVKYDQITLYKELNKTQEARISDLKEALKSVERGDQLVDLRESLRKQEVELYKDELTRVRKENDKLRKSRDRRSLIFGTAGLIISAILFN